MITYGRRLVARAKHSTTRGFKGLKQAIKLEFKMGRYEKVNSSARYKVRG